MRDIQGSSWRCLKSWQNEECRFVRIQMRLGCHAACPIHCVAPLQIDQVYGPAPIRLRTVFLLLLGLFAALRAEARTNPHPPSPCGDEGGPECQQECDGTCLGIILGLILGLPIGGCWQVPDRFLTSQAAPAGLWSPHIEASSASMNAFIMSNFSPWQWLVQHLLPKS